MTQLADVLVLLSAAFFAGMGGLALVRPTRIVDRFSVEIASPDGRNEIRSVYGGFGLAVAGLLASATLTDGRGEVWLPGTVGALCVGMAAGRLVSFALDRTRGSTVVWSFLLLELALALALLGSCALR
jgi:hypothetical protein